jgi:hypothetical protein
MRNRLCDVATIASKRARSTSPTSACNVRRRRLGDALTCPLHDRDEHQGPREHGQHDHARLPRPPHHSPLHERLPPRDAHGCGGVRPHDHGYCPARQSEGALNSIEDSPIASIDSAVVSDLSRASGVASHDVLSSPCVPAGIGGAAAPNASRQRRGQRRPRSPCGADAQPRSRPRCSSPTSLSQHARGEHVSDADADADIGYATAPAADGDLGPGRATLGDQPRHADVRRGASFVDGESQGEVYPRRLQHGTQGDVASLQSCGTSPPRTRADLIAQLLRGGPVYSAAAASSRAVSGSDRESNLGTIEDRDVPRPSAGPIRSRCGGGNADAVHGGDQRARADRGVAAVPRVRSASVAGGASTSDGGNCLGVALTQPHLVPLRVPASVVCGASDVSTVCATSGPARRRLRGKQAVTPANGGQPSAIAPSTARIGPNPG